MASIKAIYQNKGISIRVIHNRQKSIRKLFDLDKKYWGANDRVKSAHPNANRLNRLIAKRIDDVESKLLDLELSGVSYTAKMLLYLTSKNEDAQATVCQSILEKSSELKDNRKARRKLLNLKDHFENFGDLLLDDFDLIQMKAFEKHLNDHPKINSLETSARYLKDLKRCLASQDYNDKKVLNYRLTYGSKPKPKLSYAEIEKIAAFDDPRYNLSRDMFLACFYTWGSRISSVLTLQPEHIIDGRLIFLEYKGKTKPKSIKINEHLRRIIDRYIGMSAFYLFPALTKAPLHQNYSDEEKYRYDKHIESKTTTINKDLKVIAAACGITKNVSTHIARHSFAYLSLTKKVETRHIQKMLGHTTFQMTEDYLKSLAIDDELDNAADKIY